MKKRMSKILSTLLISALVVSTGGVVQAADAEDAAAQVQAVTEEEVLESESQEDEVTDEVPEMSVQTLPEDASELLGLSEEMKEDVVGGSLSYAIPVTSKGVLGIVAKNLGIDYSFGLFTDSALNNQVDARDGKAYVSASGASVTEIFRVPQAGTYYLGIFSNTEITEDIKSALESSITWGAIDGSDRTITNKQKVYVGQKDAQTNYFAFKALSTGYLTVNNEGNAQYYDVSLYKSLGAALSGKTRMNYSPSYGVTKGKTYYIRIDSSSNSEGVYCFSVTNTKISEKSGKSRAKAVNIKKGKTVKGTIQAGSGQADWYKFKLTGKKNVTINVTTGSNDALKIIVYKGGKKVGNGSRTIYNNATGKLYSSTKWSKGTYYIKVLRANGKSSGYYSLKWK